MSFVRQAEVMNVAAAGDRVDSTEARRIDESRQDQGPSIQRIRGVSCANDIRT